MGTTFGLCDGALVQSEKAAVDQITETTASEAESQTVRTWVYRGDSTKRMNLDMQPGYHTVWVSPTGQIWHGIEEI